jgi:hypothetical protein
MPVVLAFFLIVYGALSASAAPASPTPQFERDILPILIARCAKCHGAKLRMSGLGLQEAASILKGGDSGPAVVSGAAAQSLLVKRITERSMPPGDETKVTDAEIELIRRWIDGGAPAALSAGAFTTKEAPEVTEKDRRFWSFQKLARPEAPPCKPRSRIRNPIDAFLLAKLQEKGLDFSAEAKRITLIRRAYFDLVGLPPSPEEVDAFLADKAPDSYERLIDRLLASPHFGERWGRHWLDLAGYVDTVGRDRQATGFKVGEAWRYRDYVIRALNQDKPYDRFLTEQLAGDELVEWRTANAMTPEIEEPLIATGFLRTVEDEAEMTVDKYVVLHQTIQIISSSIMGLTVGCARCHSHKYDPIPQRDYYRLMSILTPAFNPDAWLSLEQRYLADIPVAEREKIDVWNGDLDKQIKPWKDKQDALHKAAEKRILEEKLSRFPEAERSALRVAADTAPRKRTEEQRLLLKKIEPLEITTEQRSAALTVEEKSSAAEIQAKIASLEGAKKSYGKLSAVWDVGPAPATHLLRRGDHESPGAEVEPGGISVLTSQERPFHVEPVAGGKSTGRRLAFARWLTDAETPAGALTARVMVNRIWLHLFGEGIVSTSENFGASGARPTHPELLEWLSSEFVRGGWRIKPIIRLMITSTAYRQASWRSETDRGGPDPEVVDPDNRLLWRMRLRRLESEGIRDAILSASGKLDGAMGGPAVRTDARPDGMVVVSGKDRPNPSAGWRRSVYTLSRRQYNLSLLSVFDQPVMSPNCTRRNSSSVVLQSLAMLNDRDVIEQAGYIAERIVSKVGLTSEKTIPLAFRLVLDRTPTQAEITWGMEFLNREAARFEPRQDAPGGSSRSALASFCQVLLNTNEFLYLE